MPTDPYTGTNIEQGMPTATCPRGHINRADSWEAGGNRCSYPGCGYVDRPMLGQFESPAPPRYSAVSPTVIIRQRDDQPPARGIQPAYQLPPRPGPAPRPAQQRVSGWAYFGLIIAFTLTLGGIWLLNHPQNVNGVMSMASQGLDDSNQPVAIITQGTDNGQPINGESTAVIDQPGLPPAQPTATPLPPPPVNADLIGVHMYSPNHGWAVGWGGAIYRYQSGQWQQAASPISNLNLVSVFNLAADDAWAVGDNATILHYHGGEWVSAKTPVNNLNLHSIFMLSPTDGWAVGDRGTILHYNGSAWQPTPSPTGMVLWCVYMVSPNDGWAVGGGYRSVGNVILHYQGGSWNMVQSTYDGSSLHGLVMTAPNDGWAVGDNFTILRYDGRNWNKWASQPAGETIWGITMVSPTEGWAVGGTDDVFNPQGRSILLHYTNNTWVTMSSPLQSTLYMVSMTSPSEGWAVGAAGIIHYQNGAWSVY